MGNPVNRGFGFLATRTTGGKRWRERVFPLGDHHDALISYFVAYPREQFDHYWCANSFRKPERRAVHALPTPYGWADIDGANPEKFDPPPGVLIETSPGRYQGLWRFPETIAAREAELYSKVLAYNFGADANGWSATKYLRVPFTYNHKPEYDRPRVKLLCADFAPRARPALQVRREDWDASNAPVFHVELQMPKDWRAVYQRYRKQLHLRVRFLIDSKTVYAFEKDRSKCIYEIVVDLARVGAAPQEIAAILWHNPYFLSKHGKDLGKLNEELWRILDKFGDAS